MGRPGLFLDLDGTLADSLPGLRQAYDRFLDAYGRVGTDTEFQSLNGPSLPQIVRILVERYGLSVSVEDGLRHYRQLAAEAQMDAPPMEGAQVLLEKAWALGWPITLVTSTETAAARRWLDRVDLSRFVAFVVGGDYGGPTKPAPDIYRHALAISACDAEESLAVEDSWNGARAAIAAGLPTWLLQPEAEDKPRAFDPSVAKLAGCLRRLDNLIPVLKDKIS